MVHGRDRCSEGEDGWDAREVVANGAGHNEDQRAESFQTADLFRLADVEVDGMVDRQEHAGTCPSISTRALLTRKYHLDVEASRYTIPNPDTLLWA